MVPNDHPVNTIVAIFKLRKPTASINEPFKDGPKVGRLRTVSLCMYIYTYNVACDRGKAEIGKLVKVLFPGIAKPV